MYGYWLHFGCRRPTFFFNDTAPTELYTLSLHDALPICARQISGPVDDRRQDIYAAVRRREGSGDRRVGGDRKSTRLNSSHRCISYAVFCLKKKSKSEKHRHAEHKVEQVYMQHAEHRQEA